MLRFPVGAQVAGDHRRIVARPLLSVHLDKDGRRRYHVPMNGYIRCTILPPPLVPLQSGCGRGLDPFVAPRAADHYSESGCNTARIVPGWDVPAGTPIVGVLSDPARLSASAFPDHQGGHPQQELVTLGPNGANPYPYPMAPRRPPTVIELSAWEPQVAALAVRPSLAGGHTRSRTGTRCPPRRPAAGPKRPRCRRRNCHASRIAVRSWATAVDGRRRPACWGWVAVGRPGRA